MHAALEPINWPVKTERLQIRPAELEDAKATWAIRRIESVGMWMGAADQDFESYAEKFEITERRIKMLVVERDGRIIGDLMLAIGDAWSQEEVSDQAKGVHAEIGYCLDPEYGGQGLATEAVTELIRICFEDIGLRRITALCFADNEASWRLMERVGMRRESHWTKESLHRERGWLDGYGYALLAEEWRAGQESRDLSP